MADTPQHERPVHDIVSDTTQAGHVDNTSAEHGLSPEPRRTSIADAGHVARPRPYHIPRHVSERYPVFKTKQVVALKIGVNDFEKEMRKSTGVSYLEMIKDTLTVHRDYSQSKLSQQELADLQKATHFDKKELQQWYKGE